MWLKYAAFQRGDRTYVYFFQQIFLNKGKSTSTPKVASYSRTISC
ncbi:hypothetical protein [Scytonema sp. UIC 10036]|nr:hypothetical protein [Scytonema sp. UIC 10036]